MRRGPLLAAAALLLALTAAVFGRAAWNGFIVYDDLTYVVKNPLMRLGLTPAGVAGAFRPYASNWHPLTWLSHLLDVRLFGMRPGPHHLVNVLLHGVNAVLLLALLRALTGALAPSLAVAALFAVHPQHVESVAWIAERKDVLCALLTLLALGAYLRALRRGRAPGAGVAALAALALAAKPMAVTLPLLMLVLDFWPLGRWRTAGPRRLLLEKAPLFALALASGVVTFLVQRVKEPLVEAALPLRLENAAVSIAAYLGRTVWPTRLAVLYPYPVDGLPWALVAAAAALLAAISAAAWLGRRRDPALLAGWLWYLLALLPVIGLYQVGAQSRADRYTYLPLVGVFVAASWWAAPRIGPRARPAAGAAAALAVAALSAASWVQVGRWRDSETIFRWTLAVTDRNPIATANLGVALLDERNRPDDALACFREALRLQPERRSNWYNLGATLHRLGRYEEAIVPLGRVFDRYPKDREAGYYLGSSLFQLGRYEEARSVLERVVAAAPTDVESRYVVGLALLRLGEYREAERQFAAVVAARPDYLDARIQLAVARARDAPLTPGEKSK